MSVKETTTNIARSSSAVTKTTARRSATTSKHISPANKDVRRVSGKQAPSKISTSVYRDSMTQGASKYSVDASSDTPPSQTFQQIGSTSNVSNTSNIASNNCGTGMDNGSGVSIDSRGSSFVLLDSLKTFLDARFNDFLGKLASLPAGEVGMSSDVGIKIASMESTIKHQEILLGKITLELHELRKANDGLLAELARLNSQQACTELNINNEVVCKSGYDNTSSSHLTSHPHPLSLPISPSFPQTSSCETDRAEVVNSGELIVTNFIDGNVDDYSKIAYTVLVALDPSVTISDITQARPLSSITPTAERMNLSRSRIAVALSSSSIVNRVLQAKSRRTRFCTDDLDLSVLGSDLSTRVKKHCKIFINEALSKERFKLFCNLKSAAKNLGIKYVWHRGGRFMARVRGGERSQAFESLSDLQAILCASRNNILRTNAHDSLNATGTPVSEQVFLSSDAKK